jgi:PAS domain-containing protein
MENTKKTEDQLKQELTKLRARNVELQTRERGLEDSYRTCQEKVKKLRSIISSMEDLVFVLDESGAITGFYQPPDRSDLYETPNVFLGKSFFDLLPPAVAQGQ